VILDAPGIPGAEHVRGTVMRNIILCRTALGSSASQAVALALEVRQANNCVRAKSLLSIVAKGA
jgi:hypothetical protein